MRKSIRLITMLSLAILLTGCSNKSSSTPTVDPTPTEVKKDVSVTENVTQDDLSSPSSTPMAKPTEPSSDDQTKSLSLQERARAREFVEIKNGDSFDLDGDGNVEQIKCEMENDEENGDCVLSIGDATLSFYSDNPTEKMYVSHMTGYDGEDLQLLIDEYGPSDDCCTKIFYYEKGSIYQLGIVGGLVGDIKSLGDGLYETIERAETLQSWFHPRKFFISEFEESFISDDSGKKLTKALVRMPNELYKVGTRVILKSDITLLKTQQPNSEEVQLQKGQFATIVASDDVEWIYLQNDDGQSGWLRIKDVGDFFDGLWYYD